MPQLENIEAIEKRLWKAADTLRSNSNYASNEYFLPVMGLIFLRHAYSRYLGVRDEIMAGLPTRGGKTRALAKEDFSQKSSIFLRPEALFDTLVALKDSDDRAKKIIEAMESIEGDYESLRGVLPKAEYQELDNEVLGQLLRFLNPDELKSASGDIFGRIYEYFLTGFADLKAHDNGEFFTPVSLVSLISNVLEPDKGTVLDPACGSGGMFVQSAHFVERQKKNPNRLTFRGLEKNATTIRLAKMNLAVHGLEGDIQKAITYYEDPHDLFGKADYVMANPPFNVDEVDADKVKNDPRLPFGLPGVNKAGKVSNGNYLWISYFFSYLNAKGRAGFVMSSQASSASRDEAEVRRKLIESDAVDLMIAIRPNFFYTRTVPCELWFLNRAKPKEIRDKILMIDARNIYRKVTRKIYDFSPEQLKNILAIVWLYRGQSERFRDLVREHIDRIFEETEACFTTRSSGRCATDTSGGSAETVAPLPEFIASIEALRELIVPFLKTTKSDEVSAAAKEIEKEMRTFREDVEEFNRSSDAARKNAAKNSEMPALKKAVKETNALADASRDLVKQADLLFKLVSRAIEAFEAAAASKESGTWPSREIARARKNTDEARHNAVEQLKLVRYFHKQAAWLVDRFPAGELADVEGLVKLVDRKTLEKNDWSLTPGRYVGVAPEDVDEDFDFEEALREIHVELQGLNEESVELAAKIAKNFEELGV